MVQTTPSEKTVIDSFMGTLPADADLHAATAMAEDEVRSSGLSRTAARELGRQVRARFARKTV